MLIFISNQFNCQKYSFTVKEDNKNFLQKLDREKNIPNDSLLVTLDVKLLYTNIPNNASIKAVREAYDNYPGKTVGKN